jgi:phage terminase small subunit
VARLTPKQEAFARAYASNGFNATAAARVAGYAEPHEETGRQALRSIGVRAKLGELLVEARKQATAKDADAVMQAAEVLARLTRVGRASLGNIIHVTPDGDPYVDLSKATPDELEALSEATIEDFVTGRGEDRRDVRRVRVKLHPKLQALEALAKYHGLLVEKVEVKAELGIAEQLERARLRVIEDRKRRIAEDQRRLTDGEGSAQIIDATARLVAQEGGDRG